MSWLQIIIIAIAAVYVVIAVGVFYLHVTQLQMVTPVLALLRSVLWPIWFAGYLKGIRLPMD